MKYTGIEIDLVFDLKTGRPNYVVTGNTYPVKEDLKGLGFVYAKTNEYPNDVPHWVAPETEERTEALRAAAPWATHLDENGDWWRMKHATPAF